MAKKKSTKKTSTKKSKAKASAKKKNVTKKASVKKKTASKKATPKTSIKTKVEGKTSGKKSSVKRTTKKTTTTKKKTSTPKSKKRAVKKEEIKKPVISRAEALRKIKGYGKKDLEEFRAIIIEKRDEILEDLQSLKEQMLDPTTGEYINENSPYSLHMAEQGTDAMEREKTFLYAQRENKFLAYLDDALKRIDSGTYGICVECIEEPQHLCETCPLVPKARLIAVPHTQHCLPIKQRKGGR